MDADLKDFNSIQACKRVCNTCPVLEQCLAYAIANDEKFDIWGGMTPSERKAHKSEMDVSHVPKEFRQHYLAMEGRVKRSHPTLHLVRNPALDYVIDPEFLALLDAF